MLHHVSVGVRDVARAATFYDPVLKALGYKRVADYSPGAIAYGESSGKPGLRGGLFAQGMIHDQRDWGLANIGRQFDDIVEPLFGSGIEDIEPRQGGEAVGIKRIVWGIHLVLFLATSA